MKYFLDTEFLEGTQKKLFGKTKPTIDLISIGIIAEDGRSYYAISNEFNLKEAWNRFDLKTEVMSGDARNIYPEGRKYKEYWIRDNVLKPIFEELCFNEYMSLTNSEAREYTDIIRSSDNPFEFFKKKFLYASGFVSECWKFSYSNMKGLINRNGKSNVWIASEIVGFCSKSYAKVDKEGGSIYKVEGINENTVNLRVSNDLGRSVYKDKITFDDPIFYGYYCDYDWVVFCWLFGKMINLPDGFPMYCGDLKQMLDEKQTAMVEKIMKSLTATTSMDNSVMFETIRENGKFTDTDRYTVNLKKHIDYPKQINCHNALSDAKWNFELYKFLQKV